MSVLQENTSFRKLEFQEHISLLPCYIGRLSTGILEHLNQRILKYSAKYGGVLLSYSKPVVLQKYALIFDEQPHLHFDVRYTAYVFKPRIGDVLSGVVNKTGTDYIGCVVYGCFNASVFDTKTDVRNGFFNRRSNIYSVGSTITFQVTKLDCIGGVYLISGRQLDSEKADSEEVGLDERTLHTSLGTADHHTEKDGAVKSGKKLSRKRKRSCQTSQDDSTDIDISSSTPIPPAKRRKRKVTK